MYWLTGEFQSCCLPGICFHLSSDTLTENTVYKQTWVDQKRLCKPSTYLTDWWTLLLSLSFSLPLTYPSIFQKNVKYSWQSYFPVQSAFFSLLIIFKNCYISKNKRFYSFHVHMKMYQCTVFPFKSYKLSGCNI